MEGWFSPNRRKLFSFRVVWGSFRRRVQKEIRFQEVSGAGDTWRGWGYLAGLGIPPGRCLPLLLVLTKSSFQAASDLSGGSKSGPDLRQVKHDACLNLHSESTTDHMMQHFALPQLMRFFFFKQNSLVLSRK